MKEAIIVGAGGLGRKVFECLKRINNIEETVEIKGFIDDNQNALDGVKCDLDIIGTVSGYVPKNNEVFYLAITDPKMKEEISNKLIARDAKFETLISPEVILGDYVEIGEGSLIMTPYNIESGSKIGKFVTVLGSTLALDGIIGDFSTTTGFANLTNATIGKRVYVGSHAVILSGVSIGNDSHVGVGSIVMKDVEENKKVFGNPARVYADNY